MQKGNTKRKYAISQLSDSRNRNLGILHLTREKTYLNFPNYQMINDFAVWGSNEEAINQNLKDNISGDSLPQKKMWAMSINYAFFLML